MPRWWPWMRVSRCDAVRAADRAADRQTIRELEHKLAEATDLLDTIRNVIFPPWRR